MSHELRAIAQSSRLAAHSKKGRDVSQFVEFDASHFFLGSWLLAVGFWLTGR